MVIMKNCAPAFLVEQHPPSIASPANRYRKITSPLFAS